MTGASGGAPLMRAARHVNDARPAEVARAVLDRVPATARLACLGLSYKPGVADFRESPALRVARLLTAARPGRVICHDPGAEGPLDGVEMANAARALAADALVVLVPHDAYRDLPADRLVPLHAPPAMARRASA
jgi:UDP-N-acetyl-D-mannosaminuronic acid dehydrogenase